MIAAGRCRAPRPHDRAGPPSIAIAGYTACRPTQTAPTLYFHHRWRSSAVRPDWRPFLIFRNDFQTQYTLIPISRLVPVRHEQLDLIDLQYAKGGHHCPLRTSMSVE